MRLCFNFACVYVLFASFIIMCMRCGALGNTHVSYGVFVCAWVDLCFDLRWVYVLGVCASIIRFREFLNITNIRMINICGSNLCYQSLSYV